jgi:hypothetical protein
MSTGTGMIKPNFFIVGKPKSGTTALHLMLDQHPEIYMSPVKEPNHFARDSIEAAERRGRGYRGMPYKELKNYLRLFEKAKSEKIVGESSTNYLLSHEAARRIADFNPDAKILMILREPADFLSAMHQQLLRSGNETEPDFRKALLLEEERRQGRQIPDSASDPAKLLYSEHAKYSEQIQRFFDVFDRSQVKIVIYDDFREDNLAVYKDVLTFLEVDSGFKPEVLEINRSKDMRFVKLANWLIYHGERKKGSFKEKAPQWLVRPVAAALRKVFFGEGKQTRKDPALERELALRNKPEVERLSALLEVDLVRKWGYENL